MIGRERSLAGRPIGARGALVEAFYYSRGAPFWFSTGAVCRDKKSFVYWELSQVAHCLRSTRYNWSYLKVSSSPGSRNLF